MKQKSPNKATSPAKLSKQKGTPKSKVPQPLPYYLCESPSPFVNQKSIHEGYFDDKAESMEQDVKLCEGLLTDFIESQKETQARVEELREFTCESGAEFNSSLPFYTAKSILFNEYLICLKMYELFRLNMADFTSGPGLRLYQRLVYLKTLILKLAPVEKKLQYQKNKLLKKGQKIKVKDFNRRITDQNQNENQNEDQDKKEESSEEAEQHQESAHEEKEDHLAYKPMIKNLIANKIKPESKTGKYVAPRQSAVLPAQEKAKRREERQEERRKAHLLRKFRGDIESGDEAEEKHLLEGIDQRFKRRYEQKLRFQEQNFTRLNETKKQKYLHKQMMKNRFNNSLNNELKEIQMIRELVDGQREKTKRPTPIPSKSTQKVAKAQKKRKLE